jgi:uroporphyrinogen-III synthase
LQHDGPVIVPLFSPRTALLFVRSLQTGQTADLRIAALSPAVADGVRGLAGVRLEIALRPDAEGMLQAIGNLLADLPPP